MLAPDDPQVELNRTTLREGLQPFLDQIPDLIDQEMERESCPYMAFASGWYWLGCAVVSSWGDPGNPEARASWLGLTVGASTAGTE